MYDRNCNAARRIVFSAAATLLVAAGLGLIGAPLALGQAQSAAPAQPNPEVRVTTNMGSFVIELRPDRAPLTVANFLRYVRTGFYTDTLIHRVVANFIIQGGGHEATPPYAEKPTGPPVVNESGNGLQNKFRAVGLARGVDPDSGNTQFYINLVDNPELDPLPTRWGYTVFGKVIQGMNVVEQIGLVPTGAFGPFKSEAPLTPVVIKSIVLVTPSQSGPAQPATAAPATATPATPATATPATPAASPPAAGGSSDETPAGTAPSASAAGNAASAPPAGTGTASGSQTKPPANPAGTPPRL